MARKRRKRPNWPYRLAWLGLVGAIALYVLIRTLILATGFGHRSYGVDWMLSLLASCFDASIAIFFFVVGASIGSFLNVVAYRLPLGRNIGGYSACPYCRTPIASFDNVPVLGWLKLRGRCRECRLPISIQYPLVELTVANVFLFVYFTELATGGRNLPGAALGGFQFGVLQVAITAQAMMRLFAYLFALSSLIAAALIAVKSCRAPLSLFVWAAVPLVLMAMISPDILVVAWRPALAADVTSARLEAIVTLMCGAAAGVALARLLSPLIYRGLDSKLLSSDPQSVTARQFVAAMAVAGSLVGWQSLVPLAWILFLTGLLSVAVLDRLRQIHATAASAPVVGVKRANLGDLTVWVWLGLLIFRAAWAPLYGLQLLPHFIPEVGRHVLGALLLAPLAVLLERLARLPFPESPSLQTICPEQDEESESDEESDEESESDEEEALELSQENESNERRREPPPPSGS